MAGTLFALSVFLLSVLKLSAFETGLMLMPMTVGMMLVSFIAPKMAMKIGHKYTMILGFVIAIGGCLAMRNRFTPDTGFMSLFPCLLINRPAWQKPTVRTNWNLLECRDLI